MLKNEPHLVTFHESMSEMAKVLDGDPEVSEFELQLRYYVHFRTNTPGKDMNPLIPLAKV